jgi:hypothetical protein
VGIGDGLMNFYGFVIGNHVTQTPKPRKSGSRSRALRGARGAVLGTL